MKPWLCSRQMSCPSRQNSEEDFWRSRGGIESHQTVYLDDHLRTSTVYMDEMGQGDLLSVRVPPSWRIFSTGCDRPPPRDTVHIFLKAPVQAIFAQCKLGRAPILWTFVVRKRLKRRIAPPRAAISLQTPSYLSKCIEYGIKRYKTNPHSQADVGRSAGFLHCQVQPRLLSREQAISRKEPLLLRVALDLNIVKSMASRGVNGMYIFLKMWIHTCHHVVSVYIYNHMF